MRWRAAHARVIGLCTSKRVLCVAACSSERRVVRGGVLERARVVRGGARLHVAPRPSVCPSGSRAILVFCCACSNLTFGRSASCPKVLASGGAGPTHFARLLEMASERPRYAAFLAHGGEDKQLVRALHARLQKDGIECFFDERSILPGDSVPARILDALETSATLVLFMSKTAQTKKWPQRELDVFWFKSRPILPLRVDDAEVRDTLATYKWLEWKNDVEREANYHILVKKLKANAAAPTRSSEPSELTPDMLVPPASWRPNIAWKVPPPERSYVQRVKEQDLLNLELRAATPFEAAVRVAISGMGGIGKSTLARWAAHNTRQRFTNGWTLNGASQATLLADLAKVAADLGLRDIKEEDLPQAVRISLGNTDHAGWLLLIDNVDDGTFAHALPGLLPTMGGCILVTSRFADWDREGWAMVTLGKMTLEQSLSLLGAKDSDRNVVTAIAKQLGHLALALDVARKYVQKMRINWSEYLKRLNSPILKLLGDQVMPSLLLSLEAVQHVEPQARRWLQLLQVVDPDDIPRDLVTVAFMNVDGHYDHDLYEKEKEQVDGALATLADYSIITLDATTVTTHRLMQLTMKFQQSCDRSVALALSGVLEQQVDDNFRSDFGRMRRLLPHFATLLAWMEKEMVDSVERANTLQASGKIYCYIESDVAAVRLFETALVIVVRHYGSDHVKVAATLVDLGNAHGTLGNAATKAELLERALPLLIDYFGPNHRNVAATLASLGTAYGDLGDISKQKALLCQALAIMESNYGRDHVETARVLSSLGNVYGAIGDYGVQKAMLERALAVKESHYGPDHPEVAVTLGNLGNAYGAIGDHIQQKALLERALAINEVHYGKDHVKVAITLTNLGVAFGAHGDHAMQKVLLERALAIKERFYGPNHPSVAITLCDLSCAHEGLGDATKQKDLLERALVIQQGYYGPDHAEVAKVLTNLGNSYGALGDHAKQNRVLERALAIKERHFGPDHVQVALTLVSLGNAVGDLGDAAKHKALLERALEILERHYGPDHANVAVALCSLGKACGVLGDFSKRKQLLERALAIKERHYGQDHFEVAIALTSLGNSHGDLGNIAMKRSFLARALVIFEHHYGTDHIQTAFVLADLGNAHQALGAINEARTCMERAHVIFEREYGAEDPRTKRAAAVIADLSPELSFNNYVNVNTCTTY